MRKCFLFAGVWLCTASLWATDFYVSPAGSSSGSGSLSSPWDITTALGQPSSVHAGDTLWLRGGTYGNGGSQTFTSRLMGTSSQPIYVRQYQGERATINGGLGITGNYTWYWGFEVANLSWPSALANRVTNTTLSFPPGKPSDGTYYTSGATGNKVINLVVHDSADGVTDESEGTAGEIYGCVIYNNGWFAPDRGHGHNIYMQNNAANVVKVVQDNVGYNAFDIGMQAYGSGDPVAGPEISHLHFVGDIMFNSGVPGTHRVNNFLISGGIHPHTDILFQNVVAYNPLDADPTNTGYNQLGDGGLSGQDMTVQSSYWIGAMPTGYETVWMGGWQSLTFTNNTVVGPITLNGGITSANWTGNTYYKAGPPGGYDAGATVHNNNPTGVNTVVRPNKYEPGRANIAILNWDKSPSVSVDISGIGLAVGTQYEVRDVQNFWGAAVLSGTYSGGSITLPIPNESAAVSQIVGGYPTPAHTSREFGAFVILPVGTLPAAPPPSSPPPSPTPPPPSSPPPTPTPPSPTPPPPTNGPTFITSQSLGTLRNDFSGWVGMQFRTGSSAMTVTSLGRMMVSGNNAAHTVKLVDVANGNSDVPGGSVVISMSGGTPGTYMYGHLASPIVLSTQHTYTLATQESTGGDRWYDMDTVVQTTTDASVLQAVYNDTSWHVIASAQHTYGPANFTYSLGNSPTPPSPLPPSPPPTSDSPLPVDFSTLRIYPNPWRSDKHEGKSVTFDRMPLGATVKLFTVSGHLVKTLTPNVDTATWDLTNDSGDKVASGIYVYLITTGDSASGGSNEKIRGKLAVIR